MSNESNAKLQSVNVPKLNKIILNKIQKRNLFVGVFLIIAFVFCFCDSSKIKNENKKSESQSDVDMSLALDYMLMEMEDLTRRPIDFNINEEAHQNVMNKKYFFRTFINSTNIKEKNILPTAMKIISDLTQYNPDEITLWFYSDSLNVKEFYDIAKVIYAPKGALGNVTVEIAKQNIKDNYQYTVEVT